MLNQFTEKNLRRRTRKTLGHPYACEVTRKVIEAAPQLRVGGRAGVGVDNVQVSVLSTHWSCRFKWHGILGSATPSSSPSAAASSTLL
jgi:phosphoglycerate dehydrogenase-like enzyme